MFKYSLTLIDDNGNTRKVEVDAHTCVEAYLKVNCYPGWHIDRAEIVSVVHL